MRWTLITQNYLTIATDIQSKITTLLDSVPAGQQNYYKHYDWQLEPSDPSQLTTTLEGKRVEIPFDNIIMVLGNRLHHLVKLYNSYLQAFLNYNPLKPYLIYEIPSNVITIQGRTSPITSTIISKASQEDSPEPGWQVVLWAVRPVVKGMPLKYNKTEDLYSTDTEATMQVGTPIAGIYDGYNCTVESLSVTQQIPLDPDQNETTETPPQPYVVIDQTTTASKALLNRLTLNV